MSGRRGNNQGWELRLGKLQVVVWLGLALGSVVGSYCVGFFAGRYVGFETARESSAVEVAKLPVLDPLPETAPQNPSQIYEKLNSPAVYRDGDQNGQPIKARNGTRDGASAMKEPKLLNEDAGVSDPRAADKVVPERNDTRRDNDQTAPQELEELFADDATGGELIIGDASAVVPSSKVPESVRLLGAGSRQSAESDSKSADELLEQRIANARTEASKSKETAPVVAGKASTQQTGDPEKGAVVRQVIPAGFFAQVGAPKKLSDAEGIARKLKQSGFPVMIESATVAGQTFYRVLVGPEQNKVQADRLVAQLKAETYLPGAPFIRKVK